MQGFRIFDQVRGLFLGAMLTLMALPAMALDKDNIDAFLDVTGFSVALDSLIFSGDQAPVILGLEGEISGAAWEHVKEEVFDKEEMRDMAHDILSRTLTPELLGHAAAFYASPLGQRLVAAENAGHSHEDRDGKHAEGERLFEQFQEQDPHRVQVLEQLGRAVDASGHAAKSYNEVILRLILAAYGAGVLEGDVDERTLRAILSADEDRLRDSLREGGLINGAFTYRDIDTQDLEAYAEALEHPLMQQVYELMTAVQFEILANRFELLAARMVGLRGGQEL